MKQSAVYLFFISSSPILTIILIRRKLSEADISPVIQLLPFAYSDIHLFVLLPPPFLYSKVPPGVFFHENIETSRPISIQ